MAKGIEERHARSCRSRKGGRCDCEPSYRGDVWDGVRKQRVRRTFTDRAEATTWRRDALVAIRRGRTAPERHTATVRAVAYEWQRLAEKGVIRARSGERYKGAAIRAYERHLRLRVFPGHADEPLADLARHDWQRLVDELLANGAAPSTVNGAIAAVSALYEHEIGRGRLADNPTRKIKMPAPNGRRDRIASPDEGTRLLTSVPDADRAIWATAMYAGLRRGELQALRACDVRLDDGVISVEWGWDYKDGRIPPKGRRARRVPIPSALREVLVAELLATGRRGDELIFGSSASTPFSPTTLTAHARKAWKQAKLNRITLHECRHTFASLMIAAGVNAKALSSYMGHASIQITFDRYGHLMPGNEETAAHLLDTYLARQQGVTPVAHQAEASG
jgi:integrase